MAACMWDSDELGQHLDQIKQEAEELVAMVGRLGAVLQTADARGARLDNQIKQAGELLARLEGKTKEFATTIKRDHQHLEQAIEQANHRLSTMDSQVCKRMKVLDDALLTANRLLDEFEETTEARAEQAITGIRREWENWRNAYLEVESRWEASLDQVERDATALLTQVEKLTAQLSRLEQQRQVEGVKRQNQDAVVERWMEAMSTQVHHNEQLRQSDRIALQNQVAELRTQVEAVTAQLNRRSAVWDGQFARLGWMGAVAAVALLVWAWVV